MGNENLKEFYHDIDLLEDHFCELEKKMKNLISCFDELIVYDDCLSTELLTYLKAVSKANKKYYQSYQKKASDIFTKSKKIFEKEIDYSSNIMEYLTHAYNLHREVMTHYNELKVLHSHVMNTKYINEIENNSYQITELIKEFKPIYNKLNSCVKPRR